MSDITTTSALSADVVTATVTSRNQFGVSLTLTTEGGERKGFLPHVITSEDGERRIDAHIALKKGDQVQVTIVEETDGKPARVALAETADVADTTNEEVITDTTTTTAEPAAVIDFSVAPENETAIGRALRLAMLKAGVTTMPAPSDDDEPVSEAAVTSNGSEPVVEESAAVERTEDSQPAVAVVPAQELDPVEKVATEDVKAEPAPVEPKSKRERVLALKGKVVEGEVRKVLTYGVIVQLPECTALLHISQLPGDKAAREQALSEFKAGQPVKAVVREVEDDTLKVKLSVTLLKRVERVAAVKTNEVVTGTVKRIESYGALVQFDGFVGLLHVTEVPGYNHAAKQAFVNGLEVGSSVTATVKETDASTGRVALTLRPQSRAAFLAGDNEGSQFQGTVVGVREYGVLVNIGAVVGLLHVSKLPGNREARDAFLAELTNGTELTVSVESIDREQGRVALSMR